MTDWSLVVSGFLTDAEKTAEFFQRIRAIISSPDYGTTNSQFWGQGIQESGFHTDPAAASDLAADTTEPAAPPAGAVDPGSDTTPSPATGESEPADGSDTGTEPAPV